MATVNLKTIWNLLTGQAVLKWISTACIIFLAITFAKGCSTEKRAELYVDSLNVWKANTKTILAESAKIKNTSDSLMHAVQKKGLQADSLSRLIVILQNKHITQRIADDSTLVSLTNKLPDTCQAALTLAKQYRADADSTVSKAQDLFVQKDSISQDRISLLTTNVFNLTQINDSLVKTAKTVPTYTPPKFLHFFPLPSRKQSFVGGLVLGVGTTAVILLRK